MTITASQPRESWLQKQRERGVWAYRGFILASVKREFQLQYRNSLLGMLWSIINPLCMIFIYTVIFSHIMQARLPGVTHHFAYSIYLCSGIITWFFFAELITRSIKVFLDNANLIKKLHFPIACLPVIVLLSAAINFFIIFGLFLGFLAWSGAFPGTVFFATFLVLVIQVAFAMGFGMFLGILNVFFRDIGQFFTIFLQIWFWLTPIVYATTMLPAWAKTVFQFNPMFAIVEAYHAIIVYHQWPDWHALMPTILLTVLVCVMAVRSYQKHHAELVDEL